MQMQRKRGSGRRYSFLKLCWSVDWEPAACASALPMRGFGSAKTLGENVQILEVYILRGRSNTIYRLRTSSCDPWVSIELVVVDALSDGRRG
jgi:hypothetical protein